MHERARAKKQGGGGGGDDDGGASGGDAAGDAAIKYRRHTERRPYQLQSAVIPLINDTRVVLVAAFLQWKLDERALLSDVTGPAFWSSNGSVH